ncbi:NAD(P)/FAD-dependent oxidoreductase [Lewinella cohaerens]|uniref:NAD(P)/FAD-dependent oxidoreductase n=1 Tax=Lewinella cohaerens TaxID=70995 RepID=UPI00036B7933|nr:NAD(P)-dependent oxidoreductase [Lewinella cohaerens]
MKQTVAIIGGGPAALILAAFLDQQQFEVTIYEKNKTVGRKFLVAGKGGFNLTHSEPLPAFTERYTPASFLQPALTHFSNEHLRQWLDSIDIPTFVGSSKRVYPIKGIKPIEVLQKILAVLEEKKVTVLTDHTWTGWGTDNTLLFAEQTPVKADYTVFALGGGSWKVTGSDGSWLPIFAKKGIATVPFKPANCAYQIDWPAAFLAKNEGQPLKNIAISCEHNTKKGEAVITRFGLEGNAIYALSPQIQAQLDKGQKTIVFLDLKPMFTEEDILQRLLSSREKTMTSTLRRGIKLGSAQLDLLHAFLSKEDYLTPQKLAPNIKRLPLTILGSAPLDEAISTSGGIALNAMDAHFELSQMPQTFCIGEMQDWNAPTGGYLLQACFSMGVFLADHLNGRFAS